MTVTNYKQERDYWCGPASAKQSLSFHKRKSGSSTSLPTQTKLSSLIGTETNGASATTGIVTALNNYKNTFGFSANPYVAADLTNTSNPEYVFNTRIKGVLKNRTNAPIVLVETKYLPRYSGKVLRHYFTISGYSHEYATGKKLMKTVDPNYMTAYLGSYWDPIGSKTTNGVFRAVYQADVSAGNMAMAY
ncbi:C39 family peptidase [Paucisalibacillus globulus]|uniref:C39 family peptidase n=1 Tax=Paucisalibacillus globulus TaxID=351095 RepID=UPI0020D1CC1E|nr:C39 family peptidase [Paucisalibacillus globulus]